jgi:hypothetical protein
MVEQAESSPVSRRRSSEHLALVAFDKATWNKARWCRRQLLTWYDRNGRQFPWRSADAEIYQQVVAEVLLQRTQASTVGRFFEFFFDQFRTWNEIDAAPKDILESALRPIGLWRRRATAPEPNLDKIKAKVLLINDAEDHANPPELGIGKCSRSIEPRLSSRAGRRNLPRASGSGSLIERRQG